MKILVLGGTGVISTEIVEQLVARGDEVTVYNRGLTPRSIPDGVARIVGDRTLHGSFAVEMARHAFDAVIDMIAYMPSDAESLIEAFAGRAKQLIVCSTVSVYGGPLTRLPAREDEPHRPVSRYGRNKSHIESLVLGAHGKGGTATTIIRPSFTAGAGVSIGTLFDDTIPDRLRRGLPLIVPGDGTTPWSVAHASDVARAFVGAVLNERAYGQAYHVASDEHTTWGHIFRTLKGAVGSTSELIHVPVDWLASVAPRRSVGVAYVYQFPALFDNAKAARDLGFKTTVPMVETFHRQIAWMDESGTTKPAGEDPFQDVLIDAFLRGKRPDAWSFRDFNAWGNDAQF